MNELIILLVAITFQAIVERYMGRLWISDQGIRFIGTNSQQIADWYTLSHIIHGFIFYAVFYNVFHNTLWAFGASVALESCWEMLENSPFIINKYRKTASIDYNGDTILNSACDVLWMSLGFLIASLTPWYMPLAAAISMELLTLFVIRDNLTLNVIMLIYPFQAIKNWQQAGGASKAFVGDKHD